MCHLWKATFLSFSFINLFILICIPPTPGTGSILVFWSDMLRCLFTLFLLLLKAITLGLLVGPKEQDNLVEYSEMTVPK